MTSFTDEWTRRKVVIKRTIIVEKQRVELFLFRLYLWIRFALNKVAKKVLVTFTIVHLLVDKVASCLCLLHCFNHFGCKTEQNTLARLICAAIFPKLVYLAVKPFQVAHKLFICDVLRVRLGLQLSLAFVDLSDELRYSALKICVFRVVRAVCDDILPH